MCYINDTIFLSRLWMQMMPLQFDPTGIINAASLRTHAAPNGGDFTKKKKKKSLFYLF